MMHNHQSTGVFRSALAGAVTLLASAGIVMPASAATYAEWGKGNVPTNSYGECWQAMDGVEGCGKPMMAPKDSDGDGVTDDKDLCPDTPAGAKVNAQGCEMDADNDGVVDRLDKCPGTPAGIGVDDHGCPMDHDGDGVWDENDNCPNSAPGAKVDSVGCAMLGTITLSGDLLFGFDSAKLTDANISVLDDLAGQLKARGGSISGITVTGHTDSLGPDAYNMGLSQRRGQAVADYLSSKGVSSAMDVKGMGEGSPAADNGSREGRAKNRRVVLDIMY